MSNGCRGSAWKDGSRLEVHGVMAAQQCRGTYNAGQATVYLKTAKMVNFVLFILCHKGKGTSSR